MNGNHDENYMNGQADDGQLEEARKYHNVLDGLTNHRADRA